MGGLRHPGGVAADPLAGRWSGRPWRARRGRRAGSRRGACWRWPARWPASPVQALPARLVCGPLAVAWRIGGDDPRSMSGRTAGLNLRGESAEDSAETRGGRGAAAPGHSTTLRGSPRNPPRKFKPVPRRATAAPARPPAPRAAPPAFSQYTRSCRSARAVLAMACDALGLLLVAARSWVAWRPEAGRIEAGMLPREPGRVPPRLFHVQP